jgi:hypothetical protein
MPPVKKKTKKKKASKKGIRKRKTGSQWTRQQLNALHECWKSTTSRKACLELVAQRLPEMPPPAAWFLVRKLSRTEKAWIMTARQKVREKERRKEDLERSREARHRRREERERAQIRRDKRSDMRDRLDDSHAGKIAAEINADFFFCPDVKQHVSPLSCIYRIFSGTGEYDFSYGEPCSTCRRMDKHIPVIESVLSKKERGNAKQGAG